jgi:hypothetical protein
MLGRKSNAAVISTQVTGCPTGTWIGSSLRRKAATAATSCLPSPAERTRSVSVEAVSWIGSPSNGWPSSVPDAVKSRL